MLNCPSASFGDVRPRCVRPVARGHVISIARRRRQGCDENLARARNGAGRSLHVELFVIVAPVSSSRLAAIAAAAGTALAALLSFGAIAFTRGLAVGVARRRASRDPVPRRLARARGRRRPAPSCLPSAGERAARHAGRSSPCRAARAGRSCRGCRFPSLPRSSSGRAACCRSSGSPSAMALVHVCLPAGTATLFGGRGRRRSCRGRRLVHRVCDAPRGSRRRRFPAATSRTTSSSRRACSTTTTCRSRTTISAATTAPTSPAI